MLSSESSLLNVTGWLVIDVVVVVVVVFSVVVSVVVVVGLFALMSTGN